MITRLKLAVAVIAFVSVCKCYGETIVPVIGVRGDCISTVYFNVSESFLAEFLKVNSIRSTKEWKTYGETNYYYFDLPECIVKKSKDVPDWAGRNIKKYLAISGRSNGADVPILYLYHEEAKVLMILIMHKEWK